MDDLFWLLIVVVCVIHWVRTFSLNVWKIIQYRRERIQEEHATAWTRAQFRMHDLEVISERSKVQKV